MKITRVTIEAQWICCDCHKVLPLEARAETTEAAELKLHEELESEGFTDGRCHDCAEKRFLDLADKADHDNKIQRELDP